MHTKAILSKVALLVIGLVLGVAICRAPFSSRRSPASAATAPLFMHSTGEALLPATNAPVLSRASPPPSSEEMDATFLRAVAAARYGDKNQRELQAFIGSLGGLDIDRIIGLAQRLTNRLDRAAALQQLTGRLALTDPKGAAKLAVSLDPSGERDRLLGVVAAAWAASEPRGAAAWAQDLPAGAGRSQAMMQVLRAWGSSEPQSAAAYLLDTTGGKPFQQPGRNAHYRVGGDRSDRRE